MLVFNIKQVNLEYVLRRTKQNLICCINRFIHYARTLRSEVNLLIQHIIVQDQDGQNNNSRI